MPIESATFINDLNASNPVGSTDKVQTLDDHVRLIKSTVKASFPGVTGAVTATHTELNALDGITASVDELNILDGVTATAAELNKVDGFTGDADDLNQIAGAADTAGMIADIAALTDPNDDRILGWDDSAGAVISFDLSTGLTTSGTNLLIDTAVVPRLGVSNTFTASQVINTNTARLELTSANTDSPLIRYSDSGGRLAFIGVRAGDQIIAGDAAGDVILRTLSGGLVFSGDGGSTAHLDLSSAGVVSTPNASAGEVGYKGTPQNAQNGDYALVLADAGKTIYKASGGAGETITIPANASVAFPVGTIVRVVNNGGGSLTIAITSDTLSLAGVGTTGSRTLADHGVAVLEKVASTEWFISGAGVS